MVLDFRKGAFSNRSAPSGGAIYCESTNPTVSENTFTYNGGSFGGSIYQSVTPSVELYPHGPHIVPPPQGRSVEYDGWVYNLADMSVTVGVWTYAVLPNHTRHGPIRQYTSVPIRPHARIGVNNVGEWVPSTAPPGEYWYVGYVGWFQSKVWDSSHFRFSKSN